MDHDATFIPLLNASCLQTHIVVTTTARTQLFFWPSRTVQSPKEVLIYNNYWTLPLADTHSDLWQGKMQAWYRKHRVPLRNIVLAEPYSIIGGGEMVAMFIMHAWCFTCLWRHSADQQVHLNDLHFDFHMRVLGHFLISNPCYVVYSLKMSEGLLKTHPCI